MCVSPSGISSHTSNIYIYMLPIFALTSAFVLNAAPPLHCSGRGAAPTLRVKGYFASRDVRLVSRRAEDVAAFQERERIRRDVVYDEDYYAFHPKGLSLEFYPGDRVEVVGDVKVKEIENARGRTGVVTHYEFDDEYESCQTCSTACPVTVELDEA